MPIVIKAVVAMHANFHVLYFFVLATVNLTSRLRAKRSQSCLEEPQGSVVNKDALLDVDEAPLHYTAAPPQTDEAIHRQTLGHNVAVHGQCLGQATPVWDQPFHPKQMRQFIGRCSVTMWLCMANAWDRLHLCGTSRSTPNR